MSGRGHIIIAETDAAQPFHVRAVGGNGEPVVSGENLARREGATGALLYLAALFGWDNPRLILHEDDPNHAQLVSDNVDEHVRVEFVDERTPRLIGDGKW